MIKVYIVGKYRGNTISEVRQNIEAARKTAEELWAAGFAVFCPHLNSAFMDGIVPDKNFLKGDIEWMKYTDIVVLLPEWESSTGSINEIKEAIAMGIIILEKIKDGKYRMFEREV